MCYVISLIHQTEIVQISRCVSLILINQAIQIIQNPLSLWHVIPLIDQMEIAHIFRCVTLMTDQSNSPDTVIAKDKNVYYSATVSEFVFCNTSN